MLPTTTAVIVAVDDMAYHENASVLPEFRPHPSNPATWERQDRAKFTPLNNSIPLSLEGRPFEPADCIFIVALVTFRSPVRCQPETMGPQIVFNKIFIDIDTTF